MFSILIWNLNCKKGIKLNIKPTFVLDKSFPKTPDAKVLTCFYTIKPINSTEIKQGIYLAYIIPCIEI